MPNNVFLGIYIACAMPHVLEDSGNKKRFIQFNVFESKQATQDDNQGVFFEIELALPRQALAGF